MTGMCSDIGISYSKFCFKFPCSLLCMLSYRDLVKVLNIKNQCQVSLCQTRCAHTFLFDLLHLVKCICVFLCVILLFYSIPFINSFTQFLDTFSGCPAPNAGGDSEEIFLRSSNSFVSFLFPNLLLLCGESLKLQFCDVCHNRELV